MELLGQVNIPDYVFFIPVAVLATLGLAVWIIKNFLYISRPNEILIFSGRDHKTASGGTVGYRVINGGRALRIPIIESVERMSTALVSVPMKTAGAYSEGGIPLEVHAIANIKVSTDPRFSGNAIERFLGRGQAEIGRVAKETLEGHLRGVIATMTPEEVNEDRLKFAARLSEEVETDLEKLGLHLDTLKIQHVHDDRNYLGSIGRKRIAEIIRQAEVAESDAVRTAEESEADADARSEVAKTRAEAAVLKRQNELRQLVAQLDAQASSEEERAIAAAEEAKAMAEQELQQIRTELEQIRLSADVTIPAEIERRVRELKASGDNAHIFTDGEAMAEALRVVAEAWADSKGSAMDIYVLQNLETIFGEMTKAAARMDVGEVNLVDSGNGATLPSYASSFPATVGKLMGEVSETLGVDLSKIITGKAAAPAAELSSKASA